MGKPKIYATCAAGCQWETVHKEDFEKSATLIPQYADESGRFVFDVGKEYKIFSQKQGSDGDGTYYFNTIRLVGEDGTTFEKEVYTTDKYADCFVFRLLDIYPDEKSPVMCHIVYELMGVRYDEPFFIIDPRERFTVYVQDEQNETRVFLYNADASIKAKDGEDGVVSFDSLTDDEKNEIIEGAVDRASGLIADEMAKKAQLKPEFANDISECTDTTKLYVLPDGNIYAYMYTEVTEGGYTNLADPTSADWKDGYRIGSTGLSANSGTTLTNLIQWDVGDVIRIAGISGFSTGVTRVCDCENNASSGTYAYVDSLPTDYFGYEVVDGVHTFTLLKRTMSDNKYFRVCFNTPTDPSTVIITKNQEIVEGSTVKKYAWANTGRAFVPADFEDRIIDLEAESAANAKSITELDERVDNLETGVSTVPTYWQTALATAKEKIIAKQDLGGVNCASFVWTSDIHASAGLDEKGKRFGIVAKAIMDEADIPLFVSTGDLMSQSSHTEVSKVYFEEALVKKWLSPIPYNQQALIMGNHDGAWGDTTSGYYYKQLPLDIMYNLIYRKQAMDLRRVSGGNGTYYYLDNVSQKIRFIMLNSNNTPTYAENPDGTAVYDRFHTSCYCQAQLDWLADIALDMPEGYTACIFSHEPYAGDWSLLVGIVDAYNNKGTYSNSFTDSENTWRNSTVSVNFANAKGTVAGVFAGHTHIDTIRHAGNNPMYLTCPLIITPNSLGGEVRDGTTRTDETDTEFAMDIVTVDTKNRKIYMTRLGAGNDREISY